MKVVQRFAVPFEYPVVFTEGALANANPVLAEVIAAREPGRRHRLLAVVDANVAAAWPRLAADLDAYAAAHADRLELLAAPLLVPAGESGKNDPRVLAGLYERLNALALDRQSFVLAIGGGALLDVAGYAAATAHRGIRVVRMPTTVLAQADSGVGVKNGVNAFGKKNFLGAFAPPFAVVCDDAWLATLPRRDAIAGFSEAVKVALLRDADFFTWLEANAGALADRAQAPVRQLIRRSAELHLLHIATAGDPFELGNSRPLDFGHWAAHKLEALSDHRLRHGEAVAIGLALDTLYSARVGLADEPTTQRVLDLLSRLGLPHWDESATDPRLLDGLDEFREHLGGELAITLLRRPGDPIESREIDRAIMREALAELAARGRAGPAR